MITSATPTDSKVYDGEEFCNKCEDLEAELKKATEKGENLCVILGNIMMECREKGIELEAIKRMTE